MTAAIDLCAGPGGWDVAAEALGIHTTGVEIDDAAIATRKAVGHDTIQADISALDPRDHVTPGLIGSPPCPGFSTAGKGLGRKDGVLVVARLEAVLTLDDLYAAIDDLRPQMKDPRTLLSLEPLRWALTNLPEWFAWEQVPPVLRLWEACARILRHHGYSVATGVVSAEQYGVPQTRKRAVALGRRADLTARLGSAAPPKPTHSRYYSRSPERLDIGVRKWMSMAEALGWDGSDLVGFPRRYDGQGESLELNGVEYRARDLRIASLPAFVLTEKVRSWSRFTSFAGGGATSEQTSGQRPRDIDEPAHTITGKGTAAWVYDRPATTVLGDPRIAAPGHRCMTPNCHPNRDPESMFAKAIRVTPAEAACLQTFPVNYAWQGSQTQIFQQIGNAIPPVLAFACLAEVMGVAA